MPPSDLFSRLENLSKVFEALRKLKKLDYNVIVVINNTTDNTEKIVKSFIRKNKRISFLNLKAGGKGYATIEGFKEALKKNNDFIGFVDADISTTAEEYARLALKLIDSKSDGIIASRYLPGAAIKPKPTLARILASRIYNTWIRALFLMPYKDTQCGAKIFKREAVKKVVNSLVITKWAFDVDLLYTLRKFGFRIKEEPTRWSDVSYSKINFMRAGPLMALSMLRLRLLNSPLKFVVDFYNKLPAWIKIHNRIA